MIPDEIKAFVNEVIFLQEGRFKKEIKELIKEFEMKLAESRMDLSEISDEYISDEEEVNDTVKNRSESVATIVKSVKEGKSIETKKVNESLNKQLVETLQRQMDEES